MNNKTFDKDRPLSWSAISSFEYDKEQWYRKYVLKQEQEVTPALSFGKAVADSIENGKPLAPVTLHSAVEFRFECEFGGIKLIGFADTFDDKTFRKLGEFKTGKKPWDRKRVDDHGQLTMYLLMNWIMHKVPPEQVEVFLEWMPTKENGDFTMSFVDAKDIRHFRTKRSMRDILNFGMRIKKTYAEMELYALTHA